MVGFDNNDIISKPGLDLGLGLQDEQEQKQKQMKKKEDDPSRNKGYPLSLRLGPPDDGLATTTNTTSDHHHKSDEVGLRPQAAVSSPSAVLSNSFYSNSSSSIKREKREEDHELLLLDPSDQDQVVEEKVTPSSSRKKLRLTKQQSALLEDSFKHQSTLNPNEKQELARKLNLRARQVEVWFQNRRARTKLKQTEVECEVLKKCCETLREENSRLQKELQHLKSTIATKRGPAISSSLCQQQQLPIPVASLTICPSCGGNSSRNNNNNNNNNNGLASPTNTPLLIGSSKLVHPHHYLLFYNQTNYPFTQSSAACYLPTLLPLQH